MTTSAVRRALPLALSMMLATPWLAAAQTPLENLAARLRDDDLVRAPDVIPLPPQTGFLERTFPSVREGMNRLPPFFRDSVLTLHSRTFYFNRQNDDGTANEALATGGWLQYVSGWLADSVAIGATYYTSLPLYAPDDRGGTLLLAPGQSAIGTFGEAWAALRYKEYALLKGYRQRIEDGYVNPQDIRMIPHTFEAVTLSGKVAWVGYDLGYVWNIKARDSNDFISMSRQAGAGGDDEALIVSSITLTPIKGLSLYAGNFYGIDVFNTAFAKAEYTWEVTEGVKLQFGMQYTDQRGVGDKRLGEFGTWNAGGGMRLLWRGLSVGVAAHATSDEESIRSPWGSWPGYLSLMVTEFDRANEKAFGIGLKYDFGGSLLPFEVPGLLFQVLYAHGVDRIDPVTRAAQPTTRETNLDITYNVPGIKGLSLRFRNAYADRGKSDLVKDFRFIINYELNLL